MFAHPPINEAISRFESTMQSPCVCVMLGYYRYTLEQIALVFDTRITTEHTAAGVRISDRPERRRPRSAGYVHRICKKPTSVKSTIENIYVRRRSSALVSERSAISEVDELFLTYVEQSRIV